MATAVQKNGLKSLTNGNALVHHQHHEMQNINRFGAVVTDHHFEEHQNSDQNTDEQHIQQNIPESAEVIPVEIQKDDSEPEIDIVINNVVCSFSVRCHLNLREIALNGTNVEYRKENGMITMKLRRPYTTASIWSSGKITCTGATSEDAAKQAARRYARSLQKLGFNVRFNNYRVVNVLGTCSMPFAIRINSFSERHREADYEPELHPGVTYKLTNPKATLKIFSTGSVTVTAPSVAEVQAAIEHIFPLIYEFRKERTKEEIEALSKKKSKQMMYGEIGFDMEEDPEDEEMSEPENWDSV